MKTPASIAIRVSEGLLFLKRKALSVTHILLINDICYFDNIIHGKSGHIEMKLRKRCTCFL